MFVSARFTHPDAISVDALDLVLSMIEAHHAHLLGEERVLMFLKKCTFFLIL
jgi:hypothetical protein